jgi:hypothetical protein
VKKCFKELSIIMQPEAKECNHQNINRQDGFSEYFGLWN